MGCLLIMSSKKVVLEAKKGGQSRKNRRRSSRTTNSTNGEAEDPKERCGKRPRDINAKEKENADGSIEDGQEGDVYKDILDLLPASDLNCSPTELPAPPGTRVNLHGVILHETQGGLIVLNVRWRNKVYSGALIDIEKSKWATDRIHNDDDDAPNQDDKQFQAPPPIKKLRIPTNTTDDSDSGNNKKKADAGSPTITPTKAAPKTPRGNGKKRANQESPPAGQTDDGAPVRKSKGKLMYNGEHLYECAEPNCEKKYKNKNGLSYHIRTAHQTKTESLDGSEKENKSDSRDESDSGDDNFVIDEKADEESKDGDLEEKPAIVEEPNGSQSDGEEEEKKEELTENEKQIGRLKLEADKVQAVLSNMKQKVEDIDIKQEELECSSGNDTVPYDSNPMNEQTLSAEDIKTEESSENEAPEKKTNITEGEPVEPLVDVESDPAANYQWKDADKDSQPQAPPPVTTAPPPVSSDSQPVIPTITVEPSPNEEEEEEEGSDEKADRPKGSSRTIFHEDQGSSLNELFAPAVSYQQYSPTLTSLNPQKINESLTDALSKQSAASTMSTTITAQSKIDSAPTSTIETMKETLAAKPSIEINRHEPTTSASVLDARLPVDLVKGNEFARIPMDYVAGSDDERSISPENALTGCHKTFPQDERERDAKTTKPNMLPIGPLNPLLNPLLNTSINTSIYTNPLLLTSMFEHSMMAQQRTFEKGLIFKEIGNKVAMASSNMNIFQSKLATTLPNMPNKIMPQDLPLVPNADQISLSSGSVANPSVTTSDAKPVLPFDPANRDHPMKTSLLKQRLLEHARPTKTCESPGTVASTAGNVFLAQTTSFDSVPPPSTREYPVKPSLLEQRLLAETIKSDSMTTPNVTSTNKTFLQQPPAGVTLSTPGKPEEVNKNNENIEKIPITSSTFSVNRDPISNEKTKIPATSLRINPPTSAEERVQIGTHTWFPEVVNDTNPPLTNPDYYNSQPIVSSSFRIPVPKTFVPSYSMPSSINTTMSDPKNPKVVPKPRSMQPVPIAPAPNPAMQPPRNEFAQPPLDYASPNGEKEQPQMSRFTLTNNRLIPSPVENRGRPRKVRVEKTKQIPIGTAQDIAKVRGPAETSLARKPSSSPVVRTSVIQGSIHPGMEGSPKPERGMDGHMIFPQGRDMRNYDIAADERERFNSHEKDLKPPLEMRSNEKYQGIGSPPGMYFSPPVGRSLLSPPLPRSDHSPRSVDMMSRPVDALTRPGGAPLRRASPVGHRDGFSNAQFQMALERMAEYNSPNNPGPGPPDHGRNVMEHRRKPEHLRPVSESPHDNRKHPLSPLSETLHAMQAYQRAQEHEREQRMAEYLGTGRYQAPPAVRGEFVQGRTDAPRSMFEHRISPEESEQARLIRDRERYMQQNSLSRPNVYRGSPPTHTAPQPGGHHSANLVLGTADGSIIGPLSSYENRSAEHKR